ncbi:MAG TPA: DUF2950 domain-containing protein [Pyrinomonadaceae bacterium]|nr:DUF2950 domain-containing protein [Pyrinomonadaceae bacterium]
MRIRNSIKHRFASRSVNLVALIAIALCGVNVALAQTQQQLFSSPEEATRTLVTATQSKDMASLARIFGPRIKDLLSGDTVSDANDLSDLSAFISERTRLEKESDQKVTLMVGNDEWPFPVSIIKAGDQWRFDTENGVEEVHARRIGGNEIDATLVCKAYALAQYDYFNDGDWDGDQVSEYAIRLLSSAGKKDGLYWEVVGDEEQSPLGPLVARAADEGYTRKKGTGTQTAAPFHGYYFKILTRQGKSAPGGAYSYIINGNMIAGFALVAYPATWNNSGVMTFVVNQEGRVYEKNLGPRTTQIAAAMTEYNPDSTWSLVRDE